MIQVSVMTSCPWRAMNITCDYAPYIGLFIKPGQLLADEALSLIGERLEVLGGVEITAGLFHCKM